MNRNKTLVRLFNESNGTCTYCKIIVVLTLGYWNTATKDHIVPKKKGGSGHKHNLVCACYRCNQAKGSKTLKQFMKGMI